MSGRDGEVFCGEECIVVKGMYVWCVCGSVFGGNGKCVWQEGSVVGEGSVFGSAFHEEGEMFCGEECIVVKGKYVWCVCGSVFGGNGKCVWQEGSVVGREMCLVVHFVKKGKSFVDKFV